MARCSGFGMASLQYTDLVSPARQRRHIPEQHLAGCLEGPELSGSTSSSSLPGGAGLRPSNAVSRIMSDWRLPLPGRRAIRRITPRAFMSASTRRTVRSPSAV